MVNFSEIYIYDKIYDYNTNVPHTVKSNFDIFHGQTMLLFDDFYQMVLYNRMTAYDVVRLLFSCSGTCKIYLNSELLPIIYANDVKEIEHICRTYIQNHFKEQFNDLFYDQNQVILLALFMCFQMTIIKTLVTLYEYCRGCPRDHAFVEYINEYYNLCPLSLTGIETQYQQDINSASFNVTQCHIDILSKHTPVKYQFIPQLNNHPEIQNTVTAFVRELYDKNSAIFNVVESPADMMTIIDDDTDDDTADDDTVDDDTEDDDTEDDNLSFDSGSDADSDSSSVAPDVLNGMETLNIAD